MDHVHMRLASLSRSANQRIIQLYPSRLLKTATQKLDREASKILDVRTDDLWGIRRLCTLC
jgi:hypothetical protein